LLFDTAAFTTYSFTIVI